MADNDLAEIECWLESHFDDPTDSRGFFGVLKDVLTKLWPKEQQRLRERGPHILLHPGISMAGELSPPACWLVVFRSGADQDQEPKALMGEIVHELGHVVLGHQKGYCRDTAECEVDAWAVTVGFKKETVARYGVMLKKGADGRGPPGKDKRREWKDRLAKVEAMQEPA